MRYQTPYFAMTYLMSKNSSSSTSLAGVSPRADTKSVVSVGACLDCRPTFNRLADTELRSKYISVVRPMIAAASSGWSRCLGGVELVLLHAHLAVRIPMT